MKISSLIRRAAFAIGTPALVGIVSLEMLAGNPRWATASVPQPRVTTLSGATPGPILTVTNTNNKNATAILGVVDQSAEVNGIEPTAIVGSATGTTGIEQGVYGVTTTPSGAGVSGVGVGTGVYARATGKGGAGVSGFESGAYGSAIYGSETYAAYKPPAALATFPPGIETTGVNGASANGNGVLGVTTYTYLNGDEPSGVEGIDQATAATANDGVFGITTNGNAGVYGAGNGTIASNPDVGGSTGVIGSGVNGVVGITNATPPPSSEGYPTNGAVVANVPYGAAATLLYYEFVALGTKYQRVFSVDQAGNVQYTGKLTAVASVGGGMASERTVPTVARPTLEDVGQSALHGGSIFVRLDPAFTASMEQSAPYMVFVTPGGEANQLYVTGKSPAGFWVRETRGTSSIPFDYRIVAYPKGDTQRILAVRPEEPAPHADVIARRERLKRSAAEFALHGASSAR